MRHIPSELADRIESGAAMLCHAWIVERRDGVRLGFTDHDRPLSVEGVTCSAASGWTAGAAEGALGLQPGTASAAGVLDDAAVTDADVEAGLWDGAAVALWRVDWSAPELRVRLWTGTIARIVRTGARFTAEVEGPLAKLDRVAGRTFGRDCDAVLGDARCGVTPAPGAVCDKRWATCREVFGNGMNFRGFPAIPGDDWLMAYPVEGGRHDGGRR
jgi:hypothetical protein